VGRHVIVLVTLDAAEYFVLSLGTAWIEKFCQSVRLIIKFPWFLVVTRYSREILFSTGVVWVCVI
jgi:hypothetical protein